MMRVGVVFGGKSGEHEVSIVSAGSVMNAMDKSKYEIIPIGITKNGKWYTGDNVVQGFKDGNYERLTPITLHTDPGKRGYIEVEEGGKHVKLDLVFPVLHGPYGEDGTIQGLFEMANIPYVGAGVLGSSLAMDKLMTKAVLTEAGIPNTPYIGVLRKDYEKDPDTVVREIGEKISFPCFVKPANLGSSVGISKVKGEGELKPALDEAFKYDRRVCVEKGLNAREIEVSILGNDEPEASLPGEVIVGGEFYDYNDKYVDGKSTTQVPADLPDDLLKKIQKLAIDAYRAVDCAGFARVDCFVDRDTGEVYLNEINTIPGFTSISMYPKMWEASGLSYPKLIDRLIELALERYNDKQRNK
ncbi:MAG: D-alanine--D-alanine ligase, partial [Patescibacteria group bacterium]